MSVNTRIKICGLRRKEDIAAANECRPDYIGFICTDRFWRYIPPEEAAELRSELDPGIKAVGVFVDEPYEKIAGYLKRGIIDAVQLHGNEDEYYIRQLRKVMIFQDTVVPVIKAYRVRSEADIILARASAADYVLLDNGAGTGKAFNWDIITDVGRDYFLAGGLGPDNVAEAVEKLHPFAVDMSSGVETDRKKDPAKMKEAVRQVRQHNEHGS